MELDDVIKSIRLQRIRITNHADDEAAKDALELDAIFDSTVHGVIIEDYPSDYPHPSCLVFGMTAQGEPVHSVWAYNESSGWAVLVTVYRPDPRRWIAWRQRRLR